MAPRPCLACGARIPAGSYCSTCQPTRPDTRAKAPRRTRGYGAAHDKLRAHLARTVELGLATCNRCGEPIEPGQAWDLGHTDDRTDYAGPEHATCNRGNRRTIDNKEIPGQFEQPIKLISPV